MNRQAIAKIGALTGTSIVIANMIGTGAFTSLGFQLVSLSNTAVVLTLWGLGGFIALAGAFSYAEIGTEIRKSGGEYTFLSRLYHPVIGYLSGWISLTVGFAAPIALSVIAFTQYFPLPLAYPKPIGIGVIALITGIHCFNLRASSGFQNISTLLKVLFILVFIGFGLLLPPKEGNAINFLQPYWKEISSAAFAVSLIYVSYSYSGWNAAAYITDEFRNPRKALPRALIGGTLIVTLLYTFLQYVFLKHASFAELEGTLNVGTVVAENILGTRVSQLFGTAISLLLISGISAMVWIGPRVTASIADEHPLWRYFRTGSKGIPRNALWLQFSLSAFLIFTGTFEQIMIYCGVILNISTLLVVFGVIRMRYRNRKQKTEGEKGFKSPFFPFFQLFFISVSVWMIVFAFVNNPLESLLGMTNLLLGLLTYFISNCMNKR